MADRKVYIDRLAAQLKEWDAQIQNLEAKAQKSKADTQLRYETQIKELRRKKEVAQRKLTEIQTAGKDAWQELRFGADKAFSEMKTSLESALSKFK